MRIKITINNYDKSIEQIKRYILAKGAEGLCYKDCGCGVDDIMPCGVIENIYNCKLAKKYLKNEKCKNCEYYIYCKGYCFIPYKQR